MGTRDLLVQSGKRRPGCPFQIRPTHSHRPAITATHPIVFLYFTKPPDLPRIDYSGSLLSHHGSYIRSHVHVISRSTTGFTIHICPRKTPRRRRRRRCCSSFFWWCHRSTHHHCSRCFSACLPCNGRSTPTAICWHGRWLQTLWQRRHGALGSENTTAMALARIPIRVPLLRSLH